MTTDVSPAMASQTAAGPITAVGDVCIVGAGLAGLNALFAASKYLSRDQKIILIDSRERVGGMWVDSYPFLRLQQPHAMFTTGDIPWAGKRERSYLATKPEVLEHFSHCVQVVRERVNVDEFLGWSMTGHTEMNGLVRVTASAADGSQLVVTASKLIKAYGVDVHPNDPFPVSSSRVRSVSPDFCDMATGVINDSYAPVWILGGGKTAMDAAHALITASPGREVNLLAGGGQFFVNRDRCFPAGGRRWWSGTMSSSLAMDTAERFDGTNEADVHRWFQAQFGTWLTPATGSFDASMLSEAERRTISAGLTEIVMDHAVVDGDDCPSILLRSGGRKPIEPGSWIVNCTGYFMQNDRPFEPYVSDSGAVVSVQQRCAVMHLPSFAAYFLTHLMLSDKILDLPLYALDIDGLRRKSKLALPYTIFTLAHYNAGLISDSVPLKAMMKCGLDLDCYYPLPRRGVAWARFGLRHRRQRAHMRRTLDTISDRFDVRCGPLR
jgi:hypothetical protein